MQDLEQNISAVADRLREVVAKSGLSQTKFAELIDEPKHRLTDVLRGQIRLPTDMLKKIIQRCGVDGTWLVTGWRLEIGELNDTEKILVSSYRLLNATEGGVMVRAVVALAREEQTRQAAAQSIGKTEAVA